MWEVEKEGENWRELSEKELDDFSLREDVWSKEASQFVVHRAGEDLFVTHLVQNQKMMTFKI